MQHTTYSTNFERPFLRTRSASAGVTVSAFQPSTEDSRPNAPAYRSYGSPMLACSSSLPTPNTFSSFPQPEASFNNTQVSQGYNSSNYSISSSSQFSTMPYNHDHANQLTTTDLTPTGAMPAFTGHYYHHVPETFTSQVVSTTVNASFTQPPTTSDTYPTTQAPETSQQSISPVGGSYYRTSYQLSEERLDSDEDTQSQSVSGPSTSDMPTGGSSLSFQSSNPEPPLSPPNTPGVYYEGYVTPQVLHRRSIERKARMKRRAAEKEVHALLLSKGIVLRGKANMLNALLELYKKRDEEANRLKEALEKSST